MAERFGGADLVLCLRLALGQLVLWGASFYLFPALLLGIEAEEGWSRTAITGSVTLGLVVWALAAPVAGRLIDGRAGHLVLPLGAVASGLVLLAISRAGDPAAFRLGCMALGLCMAAMLYDPCFALLVRRLGGRAGPAIALVTLVAGFSSIVVFPLAALLLAGIGWRGTMAVFALAAIAAAPLSMTRPLSAAPEAPAAAAVAAQPEVVPARARRRLRWRLIVLISLAFSAVNLGHGLVLNHLLPLLAERGVAPAAAVGLMAIMGPSQVVGRLAVAAVARRRPEAVPLTLAAFAALALAAVLLLAAGATLWLLLVFVVLQGAGYGVGSILRPMLIVEHLGRAGFGRLSGLMALPVLLAAALAPMAGSLIWRHSGYGAMQLLVLALALAALAALGLLRRLLRAPAARAPGDWY